MGTEAAAWAFPAAHLQPAAAGCHAGPFTPTSLYLLPAKPRPKRLSCSDGAYKEQALFVSKSLADITFPRDSVEMKKDYFLFTCAFHERN